MNKLNEIYNKCESAFTRSAFYKKIYGIECFKKLIDSTAFQKIVNYETISYIFFGVLTTVVNFAAAAAVLVIGKNIMSPALLVNVSTAAAWIIAVLFAYITNKIFVFESKTRDIRSIIKELCAFLTARLLSLGYELVWMNITVNILHWYYFICKLIAQFVIVALNYIFSKLFIFNNKGGAKIEQQ